jgi:hypothetical protein
MRAFARFSKKRPDGRRNSAGKEGRVVEFGLVEEDVGVRVRGHGEVSLADVFADTCPADAPGV